MREITPALRPTVLLAVAGGAVLGASVRWGLTAILPAPSLSPDGLTTIPHGVGLASDAWALMVINLAGAFLLGWFNGMTAQRWAEFPLWLKKGVGTGFLGSFTTLSALTLSLLVGTRALAAFPPPGASRVEVLFVAGFWGIVTLFATAFVGTIVAILGLRLARAPVATQEHLSSTRKKRTAAYTVQSFDELEYLEKQVQPDPNGEPVNGFDLNDPNGNGSSNRGGSL